MTTQKSNALIAIAFTMALGLLTQGCTHSSKSSRELEEKVSNESNVTNRQELRQEAKETLDNAGSLTPEQKAKLLALQADAQSKIDALNQESLRLRSVLIKDVMATNYNEREVNLIKRKLKDVENKRLATIFTAVEDANKILGRKAEYHSDVMNRFFEPRFLNQ